MTDKEKQCEKKGAITAKEAWKDMRFEVYAQASGNRHEANVSDDSTKMFSLNDIDEIFEKIDDTVVETKDVGTTENPFDWQSFRAEAAKDILCSMIQGGYAENRIEHQSNLAVRYANELVKQLKTL